MNGYSNYKTANVETADQGKLILLVYDCAIRSCKLANENMGEERTEDRSNALIKAQRAIAELMGSLNMEVGGEIATNLYRLYEYMTRRLIEANIKIDSAPVKEVLGLLQNLREAWASAIDAERQNKTRVSLEGSEGLAMVG